MPFFATLWAFLKLMIHAISLVYPSFLTYKALETAQLAPAHRMLSYWCTSAFIAAISAIADESLGRWATWEIWKATMLILKVAPIVIGPEKLYGYVVRPLFEAQAETVDEFNAQAIQVMKEAQMTVLEHSEKLRDRLHDNLAATSEALMDGALATGEKLIVKGEKFAAKVSEMDVREASRTLVRDGVRTGKHLVKHSVHTGKALVHTGVDLIREHTLPLPFTQKHAQSQLPWVVATTTSTTTSTTGVKSMPAPLQRPTTMSDHTHADHKTAPPGILRQHSAPMTGASTSLTATTPSTFTSTSTGTSVVTTTSVTVAPTEPAATSNHASPSSSAGSSSVSLVSSTSSTSTVESPTSGSTSASASTSTSTSAASSHLRQRILTQLVTNTSSSSTDTTT